MMWLQIKNYLYLLWIGVPEYVYWSILFTIIICLFVAIINHKKKNVIRNCSFFILLNYTYLILCSTVFYRISDHRGFDLKPLWSYKAILEGQQYVLPEIVMNIAVFVPIGYLGAILFKKNKPSQILLVGTLISFTIECLQFILKKGFCEVDDIIHNVLGCQIGYILCMTTKKWFYRMFK